MKKIRLIKEKKYSICSCGFSKSLPFCDNAHRDVNRNKNTSYKSVKIISKENVKVDFNCSNWNK